MIQLGRSSAIPAGTPQILAGLRAQFAERHYFRLPGLLEPGLLHFIQQLIERGEFFEKTHADIESNKELCLKPNAGTAALDLVLNRAELFRTIQEVTMCDRIGCFEGRVYRVTPGQGHHDAWHNDMGQHKLVALSINLSTEVYAGGRLQIRDRDSQRIISEVANVGVGDAIVFRLSHRLEHRITEVEGTASKTAFAGWFKSAPEYLALLKQSGLSAKQALI